jgi:hypothetical protein
VGRGVQSRAEQREKKCKCHDDALNPKLRAPQRVTESPPCFRRSDFVTVTGEYLHRIPYWNEFDQQFFWSVCCSGRNNKKRQSETKNNNPPIRRLDSSSDSAVAASASYCCRSSLKQKKKPQEKK